MRNEVLPILLVRLINICSADFEVLSAICIGQDVQFFAMVLDRIFAAFFAWGDEARLRLRIMCIKQIAFA